MTSQYSDIEAAIEAGRELATEPFIIEGTPMIVIPSGHKVERFDNLRETPIRTRQNVSCGTAKSFIDYFVEFADERSVVFIDHESHTITAILDYHGDQPGWSEHRCKFSLNPTQEWYSWLNNSGKIMNQIDFGRFIENNLEEIYSPEGSTKPTGAEMLEVALSIQAKNDAKFSSAQRLDNGQLQISYIEEINGTAGHKGQLKIPEIFTIGLVLYEGGETYQIDARLRYRIKDGILTMWYELIRPHKSIDQCVADTEQFIRDNIMLENKIYRATVD